ncbi:MULTISPECIES: transposase [unclassified Duganella]|uniref:transposase n=1 Tax=unclassified Duganella TaxID=2636909 RepID=UPI000ABD6591|nr:MULTISPECIES: transposase [unclassified Duganella]
MNEPTTTPLLPDAFYHVTARGNRKANIYLDERDYLIWHGLVARTADRFGFICHAYCQMPNHFHLLRYNDHSSALSRCKRYRTHPGVL